VPIVSADLADFRQMALGEELAIQFYPPGNAQGLAECLIELLENSEQQQMMATQNFSAALRMTMPNVVQKYLRHFELQQRVQTLKYVSRFRRLPRWMPSKSLLLRFLTRNSLSWARRSAVLHTTWNGGDDFPLFHGYGDSSGKLNGSGAAIDGYGVAGRRRNGNSGSTPSTDSGTGGSADNQNRHKARSQYRDDSLAPHLSGQSHTEEAETEEPTGNQEIAPIVAVRGGDLSSRGNGKNGTSRATSRSNGSGGE
jgi:hypothetical protein